MEHRTVLFPLGDKPPKADLYYGRDVRESLRALPENCIHTVVTSPPYWALRDYKTEPVIWGADPECQHEWVSAGKSHQRNRQGQGGSTLRPGKDAEAWAQGAACLNPQVGAFCQKCGAWAGQLGLEPTPELYVEHMVEVFREVRRVLRPDGTLWLNLGDSYYAGGSTTAQSQDSRNYQEKSTLASGYTEGACERPVKPRGHDTLKPKDLVGIPWRVALALQQDGWWLRNCIIWKKANCMPSSIQDRMSSTYECIFLLSRSARYFFDLDAIRVPHTYGAYAEDGSFTPAQQWFEEEEGHRKMDQVDEYLGPNAGSPRRERRGLYNPGGKSPGDVWTFPTCPFPGAHFAVMPPNIPDRCLQAGSSEKGCCSKCGAPYVRVIERGTLRETWEPGCQCGAELDRCTVLDPFSGSGTTGMVALKRGRNYIGLDLNETYLNMAVERVRGDAYTEEQGIPPEGSVLDIF